jgi:hypothetical protein
MRSSLHHDRAERLGRALVELVKRPAVRTEDPGALLDRSHPDERADLSGLACHHRLPGVVYRALVDLGIDDLDLGDLRAAYQMAALAHALCLTELEATAGILAGLDSPWMVVKGPVLVELGYRDPGARLYEDIDLVVAASDLPDVLARLEAAGAQETDLNWPMMAKSRRAEIPIVLPGGMLCDLHWHLLVTPNARSRFSLPMQDLTDRRRSLRIGDADVHTLDAIDGLLYLCLHGSLSGGHQLVWLKDLDQMIESEATDWDELVRRARRYGIDLVAAIQLERARAVLGATIPVSVVEALAGDRTWWRAWRRREGKVGVARWGGQDRTGRTWVAATSNGSLRSTLQLGRSLAVDVLGPEVVRRWPSRSPRSESAPSLYMPVGRAAPRSDYLGVVTTGRWM